MKGYTTDKFKKCRTELKYKFTRAKVGNFQKSSIHTEITSVWASVQCVKYPKVYIMKVILNR